jgi:hypothetical protein
MQNMQFNAKIILITTSITLVSGLCEVCESSNENENLMKVKFGQTRLPACTHVLTTHHHSMKDGFKIFTFISSDTSPKLSS